MTFKCDGCACGCAEPSCEKGEAKKAAYEQLAHAPYEKSITVRTGIEDFGVDEANVAIVDGVRFVREES